MDTEQASYKDDLLAQGIAAVTFQLGHNPEELALETGLKAQVKEYLETLKSLPDSWRDELLSELESKLLAEDKP
ncbi:MAG: hypothetical protein D6719_09925 [Candidatus Dadabacteria bacterium]|nr:MAG: hypothetical protein D6719_09925 [Candidatus Dadabacteria bacterium]